MCYDPPASPEGSAGAITMNLQARLSRLRLIVVTGKGGTGKSVMTAALGRVLARSGRRTLLLEVDPRENLHHLCGAAPSGGEITEVASGLWLQNLKPETVADWVVEKQVKIGMLVKRILASPIYHRFVEGAPGLTEIAVLGPALRLVRGQASGQPAIATVILDATAPCHRVYLLTAPRLFVSASAARLSRTSHSQNSKPSRSTNLSASAGERPASRASLSKRRCWVWLSANGLAMGLESSMGSLAPASGGHGQATLRRAGG